MRRCKGAGEAKVANLADPRLGVEEDVGGLQIAVHEPARMHVVQAGENLSDDALHVTHCEHDRAVRKYGA